MKDFDPHQLQKYYGNLSVIDDDQFSNYAVLDKFGNQVGQILYMGNHEWRYYVDNFPANKKYFTSNLPVLTKEQFDADIQRTGLKLIHVTDVLESKDDSICSDDDDYEQIIFDKIMNVSENIRKDICATDKDWSLIQQLMRLTAAYDVLDICKYNGIHFDIDEYLHDFDLELKTDIREFLFRDEDV